MLTLACSTLCFTQQTLVDALGRIAELGFRHVDLGVQGWAHVSAPELVNSGEQFGHLLQSGLKQAGLSLSAMNVGLGQNANVAPEEQIAAVSALAADHNLPAICINAPANGTPLGTAVIELRQLAAVASRYDVTLCPETHVRCLTEIPTVAVRLAESVPNLGIALDPSHFYAGPWQGRDFSTTFPHTRIVHLRDAGNSPDKILVPPGEGIVYFAGLLRGLVHAGYTGPLSVEYIDTRVSPDAYDVHVGYVREMAAIAEGLLARF